MLRPDKITIGFLQHRAHDISFGNELEGQHYVYRRIVVDDLILGVDQTVITYEGRPLADVADVFAPYFVADATTIDHFSMTLCRTLELANIPVINGSQAYAIFGDKFSTLSLATQLGIPVPKSFLFYPTSMSLAVAVRMIETRLRFPLVLKPRGLLKGIGVLKIERVDQLFSTLQLYERAGLLALVQEFVGPEGEDSRYFFLGGEPLFGYRRLHRNSFISNSQTLGFGTADVKKEKISPLSAELVAWCQVILKQVDVDFVAFDWLGQDRGYVLNEIEPMPGLSLICPDDLFLFDRKLAEIASKKISAALQAKGTNTVQYRADK